eukprot:jgi/Ulvmu1/5047/UM021_0064.1
MSHRPPYGGGRPPPAYGMQQGWSFTGPPPGQAYPASAAHAPPYPQMPATGPGFPMQPHMYGAGHVPAGPVFHHPHSQFPPYGAPQQFMPRPPQMRPNAPTHGPRPNAQKYANKKEREKAKRERKEARKLAENPLPELTEDAQPREYLNNTERQETLVWIAERKAHFPSKENLEKKRAAAATLAQSGASEKRSRCDDRLFAVLQEQHKRGLLRTAGTEDLFRSATRHRGRGPPAKSGQAPPAAPAGAPAGSSGGEATVAAVVASGHVQPEGGCAEAGNGEDAGEGAKVALLAHAEGCAAVQPAAAAGVPEQPHAEATDVVAEAAKQVHGVGAKRGPSGQGQRGRRQNKRGRSWAPEGPGKARRPCLLHRLVAADVRQDHNLLLQVIRFFVTNNFLQGVDVGSLQYPEGAGTQS